MYNIETKPNFKSGMLYVFDKQIIQKALEKKSKTLSIIAKGKDEDKEPYILKRGNIYVNDKALKYHPNEVIIFDIFDGEELMGNFRGFLFPDGTLNGKVKWRVDLVEEFPGENILKGFYDGNSFYGFWTNEKINYGFYAFLVNDALYKKKTNKGTSTKKIESKKKVVNKRSPDSRKKLISKGKALRKRQASSVKKGKNKKRNKRQ